MKLHVKFAPRVLEVVRCFPDQMVCMSPYIKYEVCKDTNVMLEFHCLVDKYFETCRPTSAGSVTAASDKLYKPPTRGLKAKPTLGYDGCRGLWLSEASARRVVLGERKKE